MIKAPESPLRLREISFITGAPPIVMQCGDLLLPATYAFRENLRRNQALAELPARLAGWSALTEHMDNLARYTAGIPMTSDVHDEESPNFDAERAAVFRDHYKRAWSSMAKDPKFTHIYIKELGLRHIDIFTASSAEHLETGLESVLVGVTLGAWTAFEALVTDAWEVGLNHGPKDWARLILRGPGIESTKRQEKTVPLSALEELNYDLRGKMGTLLKRQKRVDFQSLKNIRSAYAGAFGADAERIFDDHKGLPTLEAIRNLYAHRGGKVDERFRRQTSRDPRFSSAPIDSFLRLDGVITKSFFEETVNCGVELVHLVDTRLAEYFQIQTSEEKARILESMRHLEREGPTNWKRPGRWQLFKRAVRGLFDR